MSPPQAVLPQTNRQPESDCTERLDNGEGTHSDDNSGRGVCTKTAHVLSEGSDSDDNQQPKRHCTLKRNHIRRSRSDEISDDDSSDDNISDDHSSDDDISDDDSSDDEISDNENNNDNDDTANANETDSTTTSNKENVPQANPTHPSTSSYYSPLDPNELDPDDNFNFIDVENLSNEELAKFMARVHLPQSLEERERLEREEREGREAGDVVDAEVVDAELVDAEIVDAEIVDAEVVDAEVVDAESGPSGIGG